MCFATINKHKIYILITAIIMLIISLYLALNYADKPTSGFENPEMQRIFYFHLPSAIISYIAFTVVFIASILYLWKEKDEYDFLANSSAEIGIVFTTITLITGSLWGKVEWGKYWNWDDTRLVAYLILWFIFIAYISLRNSLEKGKTAKLLAVYGVVGYISVPISYFSMYFWQTLHPKVISPQGGGIQNLSMRITLIFSMISFLVLFVYLLFARYEIEVMNEKVEKLKEERENE